MIDYQLIAAVAGLIGAVAGIGSLIIVVVKFRSEDRQSDALENMVKSHNTLVKALKTDIDALRSEVSVLRSEVERRGKVDARALQHKDKELAQRKTEHAWQMVTDAAKGMGWLIEHPDVLEAFAEDDDEY